VFPFARRIGLYGFAAYTLSVHRSREALQVVRKFTKNAIRHATTTVLQMMTSLACFSTEFPCNIGPSPQPPRTHPLGLISKGHRHATPARAFHAFAFPIFLYYQDTTACAASGEFVQLLQELIPCQSLNINPSLHWQKQFHQISDTIP
jgi:hypothetical protein